MKRICKIIPVVLLMGCNNSFELNQDNLVDLSKVKEIEIERPTIVNLITLDEYLVKGTYEGKQGEIIPFDRNGDGRVDSAELDAVTHLSIPERTINSLEGIEKFKNLTDFNASGNPIKHVKLGERQTLRNLTILTLNDCSLESVDLMHLGSIRRFYADNNPNFTCLKITSVQRSRAKSPHTRWTLPSGVNMNCK